MKKVHIFLDVDGVVIKRAALDRWDHAIEADLGVDRAEFQRLFFGVGEKKSKSPMFRCIAGLGDLKSALAATLPHVGYSGSVDTFMSYWFTRDAAINHETLGAVRRIRKHPGAKVYLAAGLEHHRAAYLWDELRLADEFDGLFYSAALMTLRMDARFFKKIERRLRLTAEDETLFFDDQRDVVAVAARAGWQSTLFTSHNDLLNHPRIRSILDTCLASGAR